jgi:uncharacterized membrane protein YhiD involved in acid resistance
MSYPVSAFSVPGSSFATASMFGGSTRRPQSGAHRPSGCWLAVATSSRQSWAPLLVVVAHVGLRPIARQLDRLPATEESEVQTVYRFRAVCRSDEEAHIRALVVQAISRDEFVLRAVHSEDIEGGTDLVEVEAELQRFGRDDVALEAAVSRLSLEPSISSASWSVVEDPGVALAAKD